VARRREQDLADGLDAVFNHPNVGPFIGKQLIQHLVTSNPSPQYITRVATVFNNNGQGVRGDMRAVIRAILLDPEARGDAKADPNYGRLREPALFMTSILRNLGGRSDGVYLRLQAIIMQQNLFTPPSVFNYFPPSYVIPGTTTRGPEFGIQDTASALNRANFVYQLVYGGGVAADTPSPGHRNQPRPVFVSVERRECGHADRATEPADDARLAVAGRQRDDCPGSQCRGGDRFNKPRAHGSLPTGELATIPGGALT
jgi:hypothetical protein